jgi:hypothetical protein
MDYTRIPIVSESGPSVWVGGVVGHQRFHAGAVEVVFKRDSDASTGVREVFLKLNTGVLGEQRLKGHGRSSLQGERNLGDLLHQFQGPQCSDPRDKEYALFALCRLASRRGLVVDYKLSLLDTFIRVMESITKIGIVVRSAQAKLGNSIIGGAIFALEDRSFEVKDARLAESENTGTVRRRKIRMNPQQLLEYTAWLLTTEYL